MTNIYWNIKQNNNKKVLIVLELSCCNHGFITKGNFYKFHNKIQKHLPEVDWDSQNGDKSLKNFSSNSIIFHRLKLKTNDFCLRKTMIQGKQVAYIQKV